MCDTKENLKMWRFSGRSGSYDIIPVFRLQRGWSTVIASMSCVSQPLLHVLINWLNQQSKLQWPTFHCFQNTACTCHFHLTVLCTAGVSLQQFRNIFTMSPPQGGLPIRYPNHLNWLLSLQRNRMQAVVQILPWTFLLLPVHAFTQVMEHSGTD